MQILVQVIYSASPPHPPPPEAGEGVLGSRTRMGKRANKDVISDKIPKGVASAPSQWELGILEWKSTSVSSCPKATGLGFPSHSAQSLATAHPWWGWEWGLGRKFKLLPGYFQVLPALQRAKWLQQLAETSLHSLQM